MKDFWPIGIIVIYKRDFFKMKIVLQRSKLASVTLLEEPNEVVSEISAGMVLFICFEVEDRIETLEKAYQKIINLRIFEEEDHKMNYNILQVKQEILCISQFTLSWDGYKGNRPSFDKSLAPQPARSFYNIFCNMLSKSVTLKKGIFGKEMLVTIQNDGPVTFHLSF